MHPFSPLGWGQFGPAVVLIFWAYAGFELAVLPAGEVRDPRRTLPRGLLVGMGIVTLFYLLTSWSVVTAIPSSVAATSTRPLSDALAALLSRVGLPGGLGQICMSLGGLISIASVYEVFMLSLARLSYALASDGLFPSSFGKVHSRFGTPYLGIVFQATATLILAPFLGLSSLISIAVFFLGICYLFTALSALRLIYRMPDQRLKLPGLRILLGLAGLAGIALAAQSTPQHLLLGTAAMLAGLLLYQVRVQSWRSWSSVAGDAAAMEAKVEAEAERGIESSADWLLNGYHCLWRHNPRIPK
ncbi:MAG TPA: APC family permease, partial [Thermomicrobiaceae bacterium]|nr:APC family permease [Thermomicrobiaceae bacterium]